MCQDPEGVNLGEFFNSLMLMMKSKFEKKFSLVPESSMWISKLTSSERANQFCNLRWKEVESIALH